MKKTFRLVAVASLFALAGCGVNKVDATRVLEGAGVKQPVIGGYAWFGCSENDAFRSKFTGIGVNGQLVSGVVCSGWLKGTTIRYD